MDNLCDELIKGMKRIGFSDEAITKVSTSEGFTLVYNEPVEFQKTGLTMVFYKLMMYQEHPIPTNIRIALNAANTAASWLEDMLTAVLPFLKANESTFFK